MLAHRRLRKDARFALIWLSLISKLWRGTRRSVAVIVDVLLFSFQGSCCRRYCLCCSLLLGDFYYIKACLYSCQHFWKTFYRSSFFVFFILEFPSSKPYYTAIPRNFNQQF